MHFAAPTDHSIGQNPSSQAIGQLSASYSGGLGFRYKAADRLYSLKFMWSFSVRSGKAVSTAVVLHNFLIKYSVFFLTFDFPLAAADGVAN